MPYNNQQLIINTIEKTTERREVLAGFIGCVNRKNIISLFEAQLSCFGNFSNQRSKLDKQKQMESTNKSPFLFNYSRKQGEYHQTKKKAEQMDSQMLAKMNNVVIRNWDYYESIRVAWCLTQQYNNYSGHRNIPNKCRQLGIQEILFKHHDQNDHYLILKGVKDTSEHVDAICQLHWGYQKVDGLFILDCEVSQYMMMRLCGNQWKVKELEFCGCGLGDSAPDKLFSFYQSIKYLSIASDPIGNKGIKKLTALPNLKIIDFENTNLTTDMVKVLSKKHKSKIRSVFVKSQRHFMDDILYKQLPKILTKKERVNSIGTFSMPKPGEYPFAYLGRITKRKFNQGDVLNSFYQPKSLENFSYSSHMMAPKRAEEALAPYIKLYAIAE